ncbi:MAG: AAA family ATPase [Candidatus Hodarchaeota archaeon]
MVRKALGIVGMPGSGKSIAVEVAKTFEIPVISMGDVVREKAESKGITLSPSELGNLAVELRREGGNAAIANMCLPKVRELKSDLLLIDGLRSMSEVETFQTRVNKLLIIAIHVSPTTRFDRLKKRGRPDDPKTWMEFRQRDLLEIEIGLGDVIALADFMVVNEGTKEETMKELRCVFEEVTKNA